jgi:hypothetical protein
VYFLVLSDNALFCLQQKLCYRYTIVTFPNLFTYFFLHDSVSSSHYTSLSSNVMTMNEWWIGKDVEGRGCGLFQGTALALSCSYRIKPWKTQDKRCFCWDLNREPPGYKSEFLSPEPTCSIWTLCFIYNQYIGIIIRTVSLVLKVTSLLRLSSSLSHFVEFEISWRCQRKFLSSGMWRHVVW